MLEYALSQGLQLKREWLSFLISKSFLWQLTLEITFKNSKTVGDMKDTLKRHGHDFYQNLIFRF